MQTAWVTEDFYGSTCKAFENPSRSDLRYFIEMQKSFKRYFFPVTYSRTIVAFNCIYQLPEAVGSGINSLECIFKLVKFTVLTTPIKISNFMHSFHSFRLSIIFEEAAWNKVLHVKVWWILRDYYIRFDVGRYRGKFHKIASRNKLLLVVVVIVLLLQVIPVKANYNYFTLYKASSLNLKQGK